MHVISSIVHTKKTIRHKKSLGMTIGLVPTMGFLHKGHLSLVRIAKKKSQYVVVSIFVNPTQFGPKEDYARYPRDIKHDSQLLRAENVDLLFSPHVRDMYPEGYDTTVTVENLSSVLCGVSRPHHFLGVTTVVLKLLNIINPDIAVFGRKDYQQAVIIKRMVKDLNLSTKIIPGPIVRDHDGLAMSSRNTYLTDTQRHNATILFKSLQWLKKSYKSGLRDPKKAARHMREMIQDKKGNIDYIEMINAHTLTPVTKLNGQTVCAVAVFFGKTRLIDNVHL